MGKNSSMLSRLSSVRERYESESYNIRIKYEREISEAEAELRSILSADYKAKYKKKYESSLSSLEGFYEEFCAVHSRTRGIKFRIYEHMSTVSARPVPKGEVESYFGRLVAECRDAIVKIRGSRSIEADVAPMKTFCQGLADLRYVAENSALLLRDSSAPAEDKENAARETKERIAALKREAKAALGFDKLPCYSDCCKIREELMLSLANANKNLIGSDPEFDGEFKIFLGYASIDVPDSDRAFATNVLGVPDAVFAGATPLFFDLNSRHSALIIRGKTKQLQSNEFKSIIRKIYFAFISQLPPQALKFAGADCGARMAFALGLEGQIKETLGEDAMFGSVATKERDFSGASGIMEKLGDECMNRSAKYTVVDDIYEYNERFPESKQSFILFNVNNYPSGYVGRNNDQIDFIKDIATRGAEGIITVICECTDAACEDNDTELDARELGASVIEFGEKTVTYDGMKASLFPTVNDFDPANYFDVLKNYYSSTDSLYLSQIIAETERDVAQGKLKRPPFHEKMSVPIGKGEGRRYDIDLNFKSNTGFGLILGGTGSGKSSMLHSFILSMGYFYSPEELNIYLVDFKGSSDVAAGGETKAPEFSHYKKITGVRNLSIPHVKYLLLQSKAENSFDLLDMIEKLRRERIMKRGTLSLQEYNKRESEKIARGEKGELLPYIVFIIDEVNKMLGGDFDSAGTMQGTMITQRLTAKLTSLLTQVRSEGIGIFFAGQMVKGIDASIISQIGTRIAMKSETESNLNNLFTFTKLGEANEILMKTSQGKALVSFEQAGKKSKRFVTFSYAGDPSTERALAVAERIRNKYPVKYNEPIEAGSEAYYDISSYKSSMPVYTERELKRMRDFVHIGMTSASATPVYLEYSRTQDAKNYFAFSTVEKLNVLERLSAAAFIKMTEERGIEYSRPRVTYLGLEDAMKNSVGDFIRSSKRFASDVSCITSKKLMAEKILDLADEYKRRDALNDRGQARDFEPELIIVRDVEWLMAGSDTSSWLETKKSVAKTITAAVNTPKLDEKKIKSIEGDEKEKFAKATGGTQLNSRLASMLASVKVAKQEGVVNAAAQAPAPKPSVEEERKYTFDEVRRAMKLVFERGNRYGLFMLVTSAIMRPVKSVLFDMSSFSNDYAFYGSIDEYKTEKADANQIESSALVSYPASNDGSSVPYMKARLFGVTEENLERFVYGE